VIEIFLMIMFYRKLGDQAEDRGRTRAWGWLGVALWIVGEILGAVLGAALDRGTGLTYLFALLGAAGGVLYASAYVRRLSSLAAPGLAEEFD